MGIVVNYRDVTDQRQLQEQLLHAQKLEAVGRLAGGDRARLQQPADRDQRLCQFLRRLAEDDPRREDAHEIVRAAERAAALTRQLLAFSRRQVLQAEVLDLNELVGKLERLLGGSSATTSSSRLASSRAARPRRPGPARAGDPEPRGERARRDARGRHARARASAALGGEVG